MFKRLLNNMERCLHSIRFKGNEKREEKKEHMQQKKYTVCLFDLKLHIPKTETIHKYIGEKRE